MSIEYKVDLTSVVNRILEVSREIELANGTEEDLRERVEYILRSEVWEKYGIPFPRYEYRIDVGIYARSYGRIDALYGLVIFEYKRPGALKTRELEAAIERLKQIYIPGLMEQSHVRALIERAKRSGFSPRIIGVIIDGYGVVFVEYYPETNRFIRDPKVGFYALHNSDNFP